MISWKGPGGVSRSQAAAGQSHSLAQVDGSVVFDTIGGQIEDLQSSVPLQELGETLRPVTTHAVTSGREDIKLCEVV